MNFLIHLPGMCPDVPDDYILDREHIGDQGQLVAFKQKLKPESPEGACPGSFVNDGMHYGAGGKDWLDHYKGHSVIMMRQPEQRTLSGYNFGQMCWPPLPPPADELEYAQKYAGCAVRMLNRATADCHPSTCGCCYSESGPPTEEEVKLAIRRLQTGFVFVGITEQWALSICLGHRILGGRCRRSDFVDTRLSDRDALEGHAPDNFQDAQDMAKERVLPELKPWNASVLHGWHDPYDGALYAAAQERFKKDLDLYGVSLESCQPCFQEAGVSVSA